MPAPVVQPQAGVFGVNEPKAMKRVLGSLDKVRTRVAEGRLKNPEESGAAFTNLPFGRFLIRIGL
jgi:hypothetical protein